MKIRTEDEFQDAVDSETAWRKKELSSISSNIATSKKAAKITALRAGIALLYAHWEGLIKNLATYYLCYVSFQNCRYDELKCNFMALSINKEIKLFKESKKASEDDQSDLLLEECQKIGNSIPAEYLTANEKYNFEDIKNRYVNQIIS